MYSKPIVFFRFLVLSMIANVAIADEVELEFNGMTLNADLIIADGTHITDEIVIILHGTLGHKDMEIIETLQSVLEEIGRDSLAINLSLNIDDRHGFFDCEKPHSHRSDDAIDELNAWVAWLRKSGAKNISLLGHSLGANQAAKYVLSSQASIAKLVLLAPPASDARADKKSLEKLLSMSASDWLSDIRFLHCESADVQVASYLSYRGDDARNDTVALLEDVKIPTLVISGSDDQVSKDLGLRMVDVVNESVSHLEIVGADHFFRDLYAYDVVDAVDAFLGEDAQ